MSGNQSRGTEPEGPRTQTIYLVEKEKIAMGGETEVLKTVTVTLRISDGATTEVIEGLPDGAVVATGTATALTANAPPANPFMRTPFGGPPRGR